MENFKLPVEELTPEENKRCIALLVDLWERDLITIERGVEVKGFEDDCKDDNEDEPSVVYGGFDHPDVMAVFTDHIKDIVRVRSSDLFAAIRR